MYRDETKNLTILPWSIYRVTSDEGFRATDIFGVIMEIPVGYVLRVWIDVSNPICAIRFDTSENKINIFPLDGYMSSNPDTEYYQTIMDNAYGVSTSYTMIVQYYN